MVSSGCAPEGRTSAGEKQGFSTSTGLKALNSILKSLAGSQGQSELKPKNSSRIRFFLSGFLTCDLHRNKHCIG